jgi:hypothetical protein
MPEPREACSFSAACRHRIVNHHRSHEGRTIEPGKFTCGTKKLALVIRPSIPPPSAGSNCRYSPRRRYTKRRVAVVRHPGEAPTTTAR